MDMREIMKVLLEERNARLQGEISNTSKDKGDSGNKLQKEMEEMVILHLPHLHLPLLLLFHNHLQILQRDMVKFLHKFLC
jgi:hypothetical protein